MKRKITELIIILFFYIMQVSAARVISIANISPNWLIIMPVFFGFFCGKNDGMFAGFFAGIMYDLFYSGLFGFTALIFIYIGYFSGFFYQKYEVREVLIPLALVITADFGYGFISYIGNFLLQNRLNWIFYVTLYIAGGCLYSSCFITDISSDTLFLCYNGARKREKEEG